MSGFRLEREAHVTRVHEELLHELEAHEREVAPPATPTRLRVAAEPNAVRLTAPATLQLDARPSAQIRADGTVVLTTTDGTRTVPPPSRSLRTLMASAKTALTTAATTAGATFLLLPDHHHINLAVAAAPALASAAFGFAARAIFAHDTETKNATQRRAVTLSPDGTTAAAVQQNVGVDLIDVGSSKRRSLPMSAQTAGFSADGEHVDVATMQGVTRINVATRKTLELSDADALAVPNLGAVARARANARVNGDLAWRELKAERRFNATFAALEPTSAPTRTPLTHDPLFATVRSDLQAIVEVVKACRGTVTDRQALALDELDKHQRVSGDPRYLTVFAQAAPLLTWQLAQLRDIVAGTTSPYR